MKNILSYRPDPVGIFFACALLLAGVSFSFAQGIGLRPNVADSLVTKPGSIVTVTVTVTNQSNRRQSYTPQLVLPAGWRAVTRESAFELPPKASDIRLLTFAVSSEVAAGSYDIRYTVAERAAPSNKSETTFRVFVLAVRELELQLVDYPRFILAGREYTSEFLLTNKGNSPAVAVLSVRSILDYPMVLSLNRVELAPRASQSVSVRVTTGADITTKTLHNFELTAELADDSDVSTKVTSLVDVIPSTTVVQDRYHELPTYVNITGVGMDSKNALQVEVGGSGSFSEENEDRIDFRFRRPGTQQLSILGQQDEYRLSYKREGLELYLGDGSYSLSPLTELGRYATGAGAKVGAGDFTFQGYYNETRWYSPSLKQYGGGVSYSVAENTQFGVQYLKKLEADAGGLDGEIATVRGQIEDWDLARFDVEYALGNTQGQRDDAYAVRMHGNQPWMYYDVRYVHADPLYPGYYRDINFASGTFSMSFWGGVRIEGFVRMEERNLRRDTTLFYAPQDQYVQVGAAYSSYISVYYRRNQQKDLMPNSQYQRVENVAQVQLGYSFPGIDLYANADFGQTRDLLQNKNFPSKRYAFFTTIRPTIGQSYNTSLEYGEDQNLFTGETQQRYSLGLHAWLSFGQSTIFQVSGYTNRVTGSVEQTYNSLEAVLEHKFPFEHKVLLRGRQNSFTPAITARERAYAVEYLIPINVPVKRLTTSGSLRGTVVDAEGRGIENVLVNVGAEAAITDRNGEYFFAALPPEKQFLVIDKSTIGLDRVTLQPMPMELTVRGGEEERVNINVVRSSVLTGVVTRYNFTEGNPLDTVRQIVEAGGLGGLVIEITNGNETLRRLTDNSGKFVFSDVRPGQWMMQVVGGELPEYHYVEKQSYDVTLEPGATQQTVLRILPRRRAIQMLQEGVVLGQPGRARTPTPAPVITSPLPKPTQPPKSAEPIATGDEECLIHYRPEMGGYLLQVSSWRSEERAQRQARRIRTLPGVFAFVERATLTGGEVWYRVYAGPMAFRSQAEQLCKRLQSEQSSAR